MLCIMDMYHRQAAWTCIMDKQHGQTAWTCDIDKAAWTYQMNISPKKLVNYD
jgi:hypothetical protein